jgi:RNA polymerase sigma factor (sigma-70 family)
MTATRSRAARAVHTATHDDPRPDPELLARFVTHHDASAFATVVARHGPLVYGVCRRTLGATADADDAFQAAFLVLAQKAGAIPWRGSLGPWLFGVAHRIARKARFKRDRRFAIEKQVDAMPHPEVIPPDPTESDELSRAFDEELAALPEDMRRAVVLCELQGRSRQQAAKELHVGEGTLSSRLARARKLLRDRLAKRGFGLVIPAAVGVSAKLTAATVGLVNGSAGVVPAAVTALTQEALKAMTLSKLKLGAVLAAVAVGFTGYGLAVGGDDIKPPARADQPVRQAAATNKGAGPVATIHGQDVSRAEFADHLIRKYGAKEIEAFVSKKVIEVEAKKRGVSVTDADVEAAYRLDSESVNVKPSEFAAAVLAKHGKTEAEWREDVLRPRLLLGKLLPSDAAVTDDDLKKLFERKYGEKRAVHVVSWAHLTDAKVVRELYERVKKEPLAFQQMAVRTQTAIPTPGDPAVLTLSKGDRLFGVKAVDEAAFALSREGEVSELFETPGGWYAVKLLSTIPAAKDKKFEDERAALAAEAAKEKQQQGVPALFAKLKEEAKPVFHIQPEPKTYPQPVPAKK